MSEDGSKSDKRGIVNPLGIIAPGQGPSPPNQSESRQPIFPSQQSPSDVFRQEDGSQFSRLLTPESGGQTITFRPGFGGPDGVTSDGKRVVIDSDNPPSEAFPQGVKPDDAGGGSPFSVGPQSEANVLRSRVVKNPSRKGESEK
jgi:hypothetical protein